MTILYCLIPLVAAALLPTRQMLAEFAAVILPPMIWIGVSIDLAQPAPILAAFAAGMMLRKIAHVLRPRR